MAFIYKITNTVNQNNYIGKTAISVEQRFKEHLETAKIWLNLKKENKAYPYKSLLYEAMIKYGIDKFKVELIEECSNEEVNEKEKYWIAFYKNKNEATYNIALGGNGGDLFNCHTEEEKQIIRQKISVKIAGKNNPMFGKHHSDETKAKIKASYTPERLQNYKEANLGENNPMFGKKPWNFGITQTEEFKEKCRQSNSGKNNNNYGRHGKNAFNHKEVILVFPDGTIKEFGSKLECGKYLGYNYGGNVPIGRIIKSDDPIKNGCLVIYKEDKNN